MKIDVDKEPSLKEGNQYSNNKLENWTSKYKDLIEVEEYFKEKTKNLNVDISYDCTALEDLYFKTLNYTTYAGFFIIHPLAIEQSMRQITDAYADRCESAGHIDYIKDKINKDKTFTKYTFKQKVKQQEARDVLVILPGANKLKKHSCVGKLKRILNNYKKENVLFKKHPVSYDIEYQELSKYLGGIDFAEGHSDLFQLMKDSNIIYSTMISESALIANILGKEIGHFDLLQNRNTGSFTHINYYLFSVKDPVSWADTTFASPKSGIIHPKVDTNWKHKIDEYLEYIMELRAFYKEAYVK